MNDDAARQIERVAVAMAGGPDEWAGISEAIRAQHRELARRAIRVLGLGHAVPWDDVAVSVKVELLERRSLLHARRPGDEATGRVASHIVERLKRSGYTVIAGPPADTSNTRWL